MFVYRLFIYMLNFIVNNVRSLQLAPWLDDDTDKGSNWEFVIDDETKYEVAS